MLGEALDRAALARGVAPLEDDHHLLAGLLDPVLEAQQLDLQPALLELVLRAPQPLVVGVALPPGLDPPAVGPVELAVVVPVLVGVGVGQGLQPVLREVDRGGQGWGVAAHPGALPATAAPARRRCHADGVSDPFRTAEPARTRAGRVVGLAGPVPRGRQRRGGPRPRRLPGPAAGRAGAERRRRRGPGRGPRPAAPRADRRPGGEVLRAANTGAPLDAAGVEGLATLRASAKRDEGGVGRFGVGFAAVLAVCDEPAVVSTAGGVRFSAAGTRAEVDRRARARRRGRPPGRRGAGAPAAVARAAARPPEGYATEVVLPLRGGHPGSGARRAGRAVRRAAARAAGAGGGRGRRSTAPSACCAAGATAAPPGSPTATGRRPGGSPSGRGSCRRSCSPTARSRSAAAAATRVTWAVPLDDDGRPAPLPAPAGGARADAQRRAAVPAGRGCSRPSRSGPTGGTCCPARSPTRSWTSPPAPTPTSSPRWPRRTRRRRCSPWCPGSGWRPPRSTPPSAARCWTRCGPPPGCRWPGDPDARQPPARAAVLAEPAPERVAALVDVVPGLLPDGWSRRSRTPGAGRPRGPPGGDGGGGRGGGRRRPPGRLVGAALRRARRRAGRGARRAAGAAGRRPDRARTGRRAAPRAGPAGART